MSDENLGMRVLAKVTCEHYLTAEGMLERRSEREDKGQIILTR